MDPSKYASAPPMEHRGVEKTSMGQMPPPAYTTYPGHYRPGYNPLQPQGFGPPPPYGYAPQVYHMGQQHPGQPTIVQPQPTVYVARGPLVNPANDYLCYSIFTLLCCCMPLGIAALIYSISAREANHAGDQMQAERSSRTARTLNHVALGIGLSIVILSIVYIGVLRHQENHHMMRRRRQGDNNKA